MAKTESELMSVDASMVLTQANVCGSILSNKHGKVAVAWLHVLDVFLVFPHFLSNLVELGRGILVAVTRVGLHLHGGGFGLGSVEVSRRRGLSVRVGSRGTGLFPGRSSAAGIVTVHDGSVFNQALAFTVE